MAIINPPAWLQQGSYPARTDRLVLNSLVSQQGVVEGLDVVQTSGVSMGVRVAAGKAFIAGTSTALQGMYNVINDAYTTVALEGSDPTYTRYDLIVLRVLDADVAGSTNEARLERVTGTASSSPQVPTAPASSLVLARVTVAAGVSTIANASITDTRLFTAAVGGIIVVPNEAARLRIATPAANSTTYVHQKDTDILWKNNGAGWVSLSTPDTGWVDVVFTGWTNVTPVSVRRIGSVVYWRGEIHGGALDTTVATLPAEFRPVGRIAAVIKRPSSTATFAKINIATSGNIDIRENNATTAAQGYILTGISYLAD